MLRICPSFPGETGSFMKVDQKRKQVTLYDPSTVGHVSQTHRKMGVAAPKMFAFDSIFESDCTQVSWRTSQSDTQLVVQECTAQWLSFEWSHTRVTSAKPLFT